MKKFLTFFATLLFSGIAFLSFSYQAHAANFYFDTKDTSIGTVKDFSFDIDFNSAESINTIAATLRFSNNVEVVDVSDGNSLINMWIEKPHFDSEKHTLSFSGLIPGGFSGNSAHLLNIKIKVKSGEVVVVDFVPEQTHVYLNGPSGDEASVYYQKLSLPVVLGKENIAVNLDDKDMPEDFAPEVVKQEGVLGDKWFIVFTTEDKNSGISKYQIAESRHTSSGAGLDWTDAESPYILEDQSLKSYVYVKAIDKSGNERIARVFPQNKTSWQDRVLLWGIIGLIICAGILLSIILRKCFQKGIFQK